MFSMFYNYFVGGFGWCLASALGVLWIVLWWGVEFCSSPAYKILSGTRVIMIL